MSLSGRTALVTGGGRGIGRAIAERLAAAGARVVVTGRTQAEIDEVARSIAGLALRADLGDRSDIARLLQEIERSVGRVDVLVNNAGVAESAPFERTSDEIWDRALSVNVTSAFLLCRALIPPMVAAGWGRVVNIASNAGLTGYAYTAAYCASKHAVVGLTRAIAVETAKSQVTVNAVCPGWVRTRMTDEAAERIAAKTKRSEQEARAALERMSPQQRLIEPGEVAHLVASLCSDDSRGVHGQAICIDGGQVMT
jgi:NAD(P)-dependent dehydrogenase (short-subunit alcohol dehydrogenase family)